MKTLQIDEVNARKLYPNASPEIKVLLEDTFTKAFFSQKIIDKIKTFEDALRELGDVSSNVAILLNYNGIDPDMLAAVAFAKLTIIAKALNEGWVPDWTNSNEYKYYPWFDMSSGVGLSYCDFGRTISNTTVGSRLVFKSRELAEYAGKQFLPLYKDLMVL